MDNIEGDMRAKKFWDNLSHDDRLKIISKFMFWEGLVNYIYEYLPEDLKEILRLKTA